MTLRATITNENTSDLAPLYTTTLLISRGVVVGQGICAGVPSPARAYAPRRLPHPDSERLQHTCGSYFSAFPPIIEQTCQEKGVI